MTQIKKDHSFRLGHRYYFHMAEKPEEYLDAVNQAEKYIAGFRHDAAEGTYWSQDGKSVTLSFYHGTSGITYFYLEYYEATGDLKYRDIAKRGVDYIVAHWKDQIHDCLPNLPTNLGYYFGISMTGDMLLIASRILNDDRALDAAYQIGQYLKNQAAFDADGPYWTDNIGLTFDGGILLYLVRHYSQFREPDMKDFLLSAGNRFLKKGKKCPEGGMIFESSHIFGYPAHSPGFELGEGGAGYVLTRLYEATGELVFLEGAVEAARHLQAIRIPKEKGYLIYQHAADPELFYLGHCCGPAGTGNLQYKLFQLTGKEQYMQELIDNLYGMEAMGAPEKQSRGLWNNLTFCCGHAGMLHYFLGLYDLTGDKYYHDLALRTGAVLLGEKEEQSNGSAIWPLAETRIKPDVLTSSIGYYNGTAGIAAALLELYREETGNYHVDRMIDDAFLNLDFKENK